MDGEAEDVIVAFYSRAALFFSNLFLILGPNGRKSPHSLRQEPMNITVWEKKKKNTEAFSSSWETNVTVEGLNV